MPPKSAKRKKPSPATARKSTRISESSDIGSNTEEQQIGAPAEEEAAPPVTVEAEAGVEEELVEERGNEIEEEEREGMEFGPSEIEDATENPNSSEDVTLASQIDGSETLGDDINVPTLNDAEDGEGGVNRREIKEDVRELDGISGEEVVVRVKEEIIEEGREKMETSWSEIEEAAAKCNECPPEPNSCKELNIAAQIDGSETLGGDIKDPVLREENAEDVGDDRSEKDPEETMHMDGRSEENNEEDPEEDPEEVTNSNNNNGKDTEHEELPVGDSVISDKMKDKSLELFVARLTSQTMEEDLVRVFGRFGQIKFIRVMRNATTNRSKRCAFIQYASAKQAESAISASEAGIEVRGKRVSVALSNDDNNTLYMCNICRLWTKEQVLETLKKLGIDYVGEMRLPADPHNEGQIRGYAFLEFNTHLDAISAFERLSKPDAIFGLNESAKVSFAGSPIHPNEDVLSQGKTVYVEGLSDEWTEAKVREFCEHYGVVEDVRLSRTLRKKSKNYGYITFATQDNAHHCLIEFINACSGGMFKASIAKLSNCQPHEQELHGGFKVEKEGEAPTAEEEGTRENRDQSWNVDGKEISNGAKGKGGMVPEAGGFDKSYENQNVSRNHRGHFKGVRKNKNMKAAIRRITRKGKIPEPPHGKNQRNQSSSFGKRRRDSRYREGSSRNVDYGTYKSQYATDRGGPAVQYEGRTYFAMSGSKRPYADMEPHGGYIEHVANKQGRGHSGHYEPPVPMHYPPHAGTQYHPHVGHPQSEVGTYQYTHAIYQNTPAQARYVDPALGAHAQPHAGYLQPTAVNSSHSVGSGGTQDPHGATPSVYGAGSSIPPSHPPYYPSHVGYEAGSSGGGYYPSTEGNQPWPGTYY